MKHPIKMFFALLLCIGTLFLSGCWDQKIFERIGFILQIGLELDGEGKLLHSITMPVVSEEIEQKVEVLSASANLLREARESSRNVSGRRVEGGKAQHIHFSKELAKNGIGELLEIFLRNPENPLLANIVVVDGSPKDMFQKSLNYKDKGRLAFYMAQLIDDARKRTATPEARVYEFAILEHSETIDPIANYIGYDDKEIQVLGTALFNGDKMVGDLGIVDTGLLHALMAEKINFQYYYGEGKLPDDRNDGKNGIAVALSGVKRKIEVGIKDNKPDIKIKLEFTGTVAEYKLGQHLEDKKVETRLESEIGKSIQKDLEKVLKYLQEVSADPVGFGELVRVKYNQYYKTIKWDDIYKEISFTVDAKLDLESFGAMN